MKKSIIAMVLILLIVSLTPASAYCMGSFNDKNVNYNINSTNNVLNNSNSTVFNKTRVLEEWFKPTDMYMVVEWTCTKMLQYHGTVLDLYMAKNRTTLENTLDYALLTNKNVILLLNPNESKNGDLLLYLKDGKVFGEKDPLNPEKYVKTQESVYVFESNTGKNIIPKNFTKEVKGLTGAVLTVQGKENMSSVMGHFTEIFNKYNSSNAVNNTNNTVNNTNNTVNGINATSGVPGNLNSTGLTKIFGSLSQYEICLIANIALLPFLCYYRMYAAPVPWKDVKSGMIVLCHQPRTDNPNNKQFIPYLVCNVTNTTMTILEPGRNLRFNVNKAEYEKYYTGICIKPVDGKLNDYNDTIIESASLLTCIHNSDLYTADVMRGRMLLGFKSIFDSISSMNTTDLSPKSNPLINAMMVVTKLNRENHYGTLEKLTLAEVREKRQEHGLAILLLKDNDRTLITDNFDSDSFVYANVGNIHPNNFDLQFNGKDQIIKDEILSKYYTGYVIFVDDIRNDQAGDIFEKINMYNIQFNVCYNNTEKDSTWGEWFIDSAESLMPQGYQDAFFKYGMIAAAIGGIIWYTSAVFTYFAGATIVVNTAVATAAAGTTVLTATTTTTGLLATGGAVTAGAVLATAAVVVVTVIAVAAVCWLTYKCVKYLWEKQHGTNRGTIIEDFKKKYKRGKG